MAAVDGVSPDVPPAAPPEAPPAAPPTSQRPCDWCGKEMDAEAKFCLNCKYAQGRQCAICKAPMWQGAVRCNACGTYRKWRRIVNFSTAVPTLLLAVLGAVWTAVIPLLAYYNERNSHTSIKVTGSDENQIYVKVWNTGRKPSALIRYRLKFDRMTGSAEKEATLEPNDEQQRTQSVIEPKEKPVTLALSVPRLKDLLKTQYTPEEVAAHLANRGSWSTIPVTLEIEVRESDDDPGTSQPIRDPIVAEQIARFLPRLMP